MPELTGGVLGWNFEKHHSVVHKVRDIIRLGWSEIFGHHGPEHGHIDNIKRLAGCVNNKEVYLTVLKAHAHAGHLSYLRSLEVDLLTQQLQRTTRQRRRIIKLERNWT